MSRVRISFPAPSIRTVFFIFLASQAGRRYSQVVRPRSAKPLSPGSNPGGASRQVKNAEFFGVFRTISRCGGIGRRKGLKIPRTRVRAGSSPASGTRIWGKIFGFYPIFLPLGKNWGKDFGLFTPIFALFSSFSGLLPLFLLISHKSYSIL